MVWKEEYGKEGLQERKVWLMAAMDWRKVIRRRDWSNREEKRRDQEEMVELVELSTNAGHRAILWWVFFSS